MKTLVKKSNLCKTNNVFILAKEVKNSIFFEKEDKELLLSQLKRKLIRDGCGTSCYTLIRIYAGTEIEDICWQVLDFFDYMKKPRFRGIWVS